MKEKETFRIYVEVKVIGIGPSLLWNTRLLLYDSDFAGSFPYKSINTEENSGSAALNSKSSNNKKRP